MSSAYVIHQLTSHKTEIIPTGVMKVGLFGSFVRGEERATSDIDLLVEFHPGQKSYRNLLHFAEIAERILGRHVEVVTPEGLSPFIKPHILKEIKYVEIT